jgi:hypothetical protein
MTVKITRTDVSTVSDALSPLGMAQSVGWATQLHGINSSISFCGPAVHEACQPVGEIDLRIDAVDFTGLDERSQTCPVLRPFVRTGAYCQVSDIRSRGYLSVSSAGRPDSSCDRRPRA